MKRIDKITDAVTGIAEEITITMDKEAVDAVFDEIIDSSEKLTETPTPDYSGMGVYKNGVIVNFKYKE